MYFENTKVENIVVDQEFLTNILKKHGLECHGAWDYDRMTFDRRFDVREGRFYLRVFCEAISGDVGAHDATLKILKPVLGKYYYPHGVEFPSRTHAIHSGGVHHNGCHAIASPQEEDASVKQWGSGLCITQCQEVKGSSQHKDGE